MLCDCRMGRRTSLLAILFMLTLPLCGCLREPGAEGLNVAPPAAWRPIAPADAPAVPGTMLAAWSGPQGASLVAYRSLPAPGVSAGGLADDLANRLANLPEMREVARRVETYGGARAARVELVAPGTGRALASSGTGVPVAPQGQALVPTHRVVIGFPRSDRTLWLAWHYPESASAEVAPQVEAMLSKLTLGPPSR